ncbi:54S ribosomal protein L19, mitochondrial [Morella rubra]|uniref:Large ribosomal subunit protein uL11m n=1 Tax=Morella rubra TaxID=262757 RepID=A0A6A1W0K2_9ROSI|nr:54S ribosomal protein L19, mitochondrial [Morella rubra]
MDAFSFVDDLYETRRHVDPERDPHPAARFSDDLAYHPCRWSPPSTTCGTCTGAVPAEPSGLLQGLQCMHSEVQAFCKDFNARTQKYKPDTPMAMTITAFKDNTLVFTVKSPSVTWYIKKAAGVESGSGRLGHEVISTVTLKHVYEIAKIKQSDPYCQFMPLKSICKSIIGTTNTMGIKVVKELE